MLYIVYRILYFCCSEGSNQSRSQTWHSCLAPLSKISLSLFYLLLDKEDEEEHIRGVRITIIVVLLSIVLASLESNESSNQRISQTWHSGLSQLIIFVCSAQFNLLNCHVIMYSIFC